MYSQCIWSDPGPFSEIMKFGLEMTSPYSKSSLFWSKSRADAQCWKICFRAFTQESEWFHYMVRSTLLPVGWGRQIAQVPKCHISKYHAKFGHVFSTYHIEKWHRAQKCHLGKLEQGVRSSWISLVSSRSQNHPWENEERGFQLDEMLDFESHQNQHGNIPGITRDHRRPLGVIPSVSTMILSDSKKSWNLAPTWRLSTPKWWSRSIFAVLAHNATSY